MSESITTFCCECDGPKSHRLTLDGGDAGNYILELCASCNQKQDRKFVLKEELVP